MYAGISAAFLDALRSPHTAYGYLEAWYNGARLTVDDGLGGQITRLPLHEAGTNQVVVDAATPGVRRTLTATLAPTPGLWDALAPVGTELRAYTVLRHPSGVTETVPQGVFVVDVQKMGYAPDGTLSLTAPDRWVRVQNGRFLAPRGFGGGLARDLIATLLAEVLPAGTAVTDTATSTATVPSQTVDRDRDKFVQDLAAAAGADVFFDRDGNPVIRDVPVLDPANPAWTVDAGATGVLIGADRERNRQKTYNLVVVTASTPDGTAPFAPQYVWDSDVNSPTYAGPDPVNHPEQAGPFGVRPTFYASPLLTTAAQAQAAGATVLARVTGLAAQLTLTSAPNPALDDGDTITVLLPAKRRTDTRPLEVHLVDGFTVPLVPSRNPMPISTRSTRPDDVQEA